jgi:peptidoglycan/LPS O-acetylase OafA/YrhL
MFHISEKLLPGGYLGVDIFFVISGYLITNVIWREAVNQEYSIARFYERRIRRIMTALVALLLTVSLFSIALLLPIDLKKYAHSVLASLGFIANVYFWRDTDYFSRLADEKPLLHLWSLGVEEQFYILFPMLVLVCVKWRRVSLLHITTLLVILSFLLNVFAIRKGGSSPAFYLLPTRSWELGAGAILALVQSKRSGISKWYQPLGVAAMVLLVVGLFLNGTSLTSAGVPSAVWVVLGTSLTICLGNSGESWFTDFLSSRLLVWIGLISYSLYLWHWPILVFARYYLVESNLSLTQTIILFLTMLVAAVLSWRFIERPFRDRAVPIRNVLVWTVSGCVVVISGSAVVLASNGLPFRYNSEIVQINSAVGSEFRCGVRDLFAFGGSRACLLAATGADPTDATVALVGNSHAQMYAPLVSDILRKSNLVGILVPLNGCLPIPDYNESYVCMEQAAKDLSAVKALPHVRIIILAMTWDFSARMYTADGAVPSGSQARVFCESLDRVINEYERAGKTVVLVGPLAIPGHDVASIVARQMAFGHRVTEPMYTPESEFLAKYQGIISHYELRPDVILIRPDRIQCQNLRCEYFCDGSSLFADDNHLAQDSLSFFRPAFQTALHSAFKHALG